MIVVIVTTHNISCLGHRQEMEKHKQLLDKEYEQLLTQFSKVIICTYHQPALNDDYLHPRKEISTRNHIMR